MAGEQLRVTEGKERGKLIGIDADLLIGRLAPEDEGRLGGDAEISRRHARVARGADGQLAIEDLGSANGTFVNDLRIDTPRTLVAGDRVRVGKTVLEVTPVAAAAAEQTMPAAAETMLAVPEPEPEPVVLVVAGGPGSGRRLELDDELLLGRAVSGDGKLAEDNELSRRHARISRGDTGELAIEDLGSANGTFVNGQRINSRVVLDAGRLGPGWLDDDQGQSRHGRAGTGGGSGGGCSSDAGRSRGAGRPSDAARPGDAASPSRADRPADAAWPAAAGLPSGAAAASVSATCSAPRRTAAAARGADRRPRGQPAPRQRVRRLPG